MESEGVRSLPEELERKDRKTKMERDVAVLGVGAHPWGKFNDKDFIDLAVIAANEAFKDAGIGWKDIQAMVCAETVWSGKSGLYAGQFVSRALGSTGIPAVNIQNGCASGAVALAIAAMMIKSGMCDIALAVGGDVSPEGFLPALAGEDPLSPDSLRFTAIGATNPVHWALDCRRRMEEYGTTEAHLAKVKVKNSKYGSSNPLARYRKVFTLEEVLNSAVVCYPLRLYEICATSDGGGAVILSSMEVARRYTSRPVILAAATLGNLVYGDPTVQIGSHVAYKVNSSVPMASEVVQSSRKAYEEAGIGPEELDFAELPDNSSWHELMYMEALGFCGPGEAERLLDDGATELAGRLPINASGGFASFGEAVAAQGLLQVYEIVRQLREQAGPRQVQGAKVGFGQVYGAQGNAGTVIVKK